MKHLLSLMACFCMLGNVVIAGNIYIPEEASPSKSEAYNIFFVDVDNEILLVDFSMIPNDLLEINLKKDEEVVLTIDVSEVASDAIFELNLSNYYEGIYIVELVIANAIRIQKEIKID